MIAHTFDKLAPVIDLAEYRARRTNPQDNPTPPAPAMVLTLPVMEVAA